MGWDGLTNYKKFSLSSSLSLIILSRCWKVVSIVEHRKKIFFFRERENFLGLTRYEQLCSFFDLFKYISYLLQWDDYVKYVLIRFITPVNICFNIIHNLEGERPWDMSIWLMQSAYFYIYDQLCYRRLFFPLWHP